MRRKVIVAGLAVIAMIAPVAVSLMPTTENSYLSTLASAVEKSRSAVLTVAEVGETRAQGRITGVATQVAIEDALDDAQSALDELVTEEVPTDRSRRLRDEAVPLLTTATSLMNDAAVANDAGDKGALTSTRDELRALADALTSVQERAQ